MNRAFMRPRPHVLAHKREIRREQALQHRQGQAQQQMDAVNLIVE